MRHVFRLTALLALISLPANAQAAGQRVSVKGELVDTFCSVTGIMFAAGTAHHQCAVWCAAGGVPVSIKDAKGDYYMVLKIEEDDNSVANPKLVTIMTHEVTVDGELIERDGTRYLLVSKVADDKGVVNLTHEEFGVTPFGN